jgi:hypothetical protein
MRFRLLETPHMDLIARIEKLSDDTFSLKDKQNLAIELMTKLKIRNCPITYLVQDVNDNKHPVFDLVQQLFYIHNNNPAVCEVFKKLKIKEIPQKYFDNIISVISSLEKIGSKSINKLENILISRSFYVRSKPEFDYTFKVLSTLMNPSAFSKYFKDPSVVKLEDLMDGNELKPAGISPKDPTNNSIFGIVNSWTNGQSGKSEEKKGAADQQSTESHDTTYVSFEEVDKRIHEPEIGDRIHIDGDFIYDDNHKNEEAFGWRPVVFYRN